MKSEIHLLSPRAITEDGIPPCPYCRPDTDLGVL
jgi:hypothetical protein